MSHTLRLLLLVTALLTAVWILRKIRRLKVRMEDAIYWVVVAVLLAVLGIFPEVSYYLTRKLGMISPSNLIFLVIIFLLMEKVFTLSILVSQLEDKVTVLSAEVALRAHSAEKRLKTYDEGQLGTKEEAAGVKEEIAGVKEEEAGAEPAMAEKTAAKETGSGRRE